MNETKIMIGFLLLLAAMVLATEGEPSSGSGGGGGALVVPTYKAYSGQGAFNLKIGESVIAAEDYSLKVTGVNLPDSSTSASVIFEVYDSAGKMIDEIKAGEGTGISIGNSIINIEDIRTQGEAGGSMVKVAVSEIANTAGATAAKISDSQIKPILIRPRPTIIPGDQPPSPPDEDIPLEGTRHTLYFNAGWNMVSFPYYYQQDYGCRGGVCPLAADAGMPLLYPAPSLKVIENTCDSKTLWHYEYGAYRKYELGSYLNPQMLGYWLKAGNACKITIEGNNEIDWQGMQLSAGWNQIGGPAQNTLFEKMKGSCEALSGPWKYNSFARKYEKAEVLKPGEGYFLKVAGQCTLGNYDDSDLPPFPEDPIYPTPYPIGNATTSPIEQTYPVRPTNVLNKETITLGKGESAKVFGLTITLQELGADKVTILPIMGPVRDNYNPGMMPTEKITLNEFGEPLALSLNDEKVMDRLFNYFKLVKIADGKATIEVYFKASLLARIVLHRTMRTCATNAPIKDEYGREEQIFTVGENSGYWNFRCYSRYQEQCIEDGSFDQYYDENCERIN